MKFRIIAAIIALSAPIAILYAITQYAGDANQSTSARSPAPSAPAYRFPPHDKGSAAKPPSREGEMEFLRKRLSDLEKMSDKEWQEEHERRMPARPRPRHMPGHDQLPQDPNAGRAPELAPPPASPLIEDFPAERPAN